MTKSRKILIIVLFSVLAVLIVIAACLGVYAFKLYNKMTYDPQGTFADSVVVNDALLRAYDKLNEGVSIDEVVLDPELTEDQIKVLREYALGLNFETDFTGKTDVVTTVERPVIDQPVVTQDVINILFLGTDERGNETAQHTDSMIVVSINTKTQEVTFTSLLRDMYIEIVGLGRWDRLNTAFSFGGIQWLTDTIKLYLGIEIDNYVRVNFESFKTIINELGGVDVPFNEIKEIRDEEIARLRRQSDFSTSQLVKGTEGTYHLTGEQALYYCRDRYSGNTIKGGKDGDFGRTDRQRRVMGALVKKAQSMSFTDLLSAMEEILPLVTTDLLMEDCVKLLTSVMTTYDDFKTRSYCIPSGKYGDYADYVYKTLPNGNEVIQVNNYANQGKMWKELIYGE